MVQLRIVEEGVVGAPADLTYRLIADMQHHHPQFLPPAFRDLRVESGGYGTGTTYTMQVTLGGKTRAMQMRMEEPTPGKVITEADLTTPLQTTWTITPEGAHCRVQLVTTWSSAAGLQGFFERLFSPAILRRVYRDELQRLDRYARTQVGATPQDGVATGV